MTADSAEDADERAAFSINARTTCPIDTIEKRDEKRARLRKTAGDRGRGQGSMGRRSEVGGRRSGVGGRAAGEGTEDSEGRKEGVRWLSRVRAGERGGVMAGGYLTAQVVVGRISASSPPKR